MNRSELIKKLATDTELPQATLGAVLNSLIDTIQTTVKKGEALTLIGFGTFKLTKRAARTAKNPSTGAALKLPASLVPKFTAGSKFKAVVDPKNAARKAKAKATAVK